MVLHLRFADSRAVRQGYHEMRYACVSELAGVDYPDEDFSQYRAFVHFQGPATACNTAFDYPTAEMQVLNVDSG